MTAEIDSTMLRTLAILEAARERDVDALAALLTTDDPADSVILVMDLALFALSAIDTLAMATATSGDGVLAGLRRTLMTQIVEGRR